MIYRTIYKTIAKEKQQLVSIKTIKEYLRITDIEDDSLLDNIITAAIDIAERLTRTSIVPKTILITARGKQNISLPVKPLLKINSVKLLENDTERILTNTEYQLFMDIICLNELPKSSEQLQIEYVAGENFLLDNLAGLKQALLQHIAYLYDNRGLGCGVNNMLTELYQPYRNMVI